LEKTSGTLVVLVVGVLTRQQDAGIDETKGSTIRPMCLDQLSYPCPVAGDRTIKVPYLGHALRALDAPPMQGLFG
jgi:hypothetical protein